MKLHMSVHAVGMVEVIPQPDGSFMIAVDGECQEHIGVAIIGKLDIQAEEVQHVLAAAEAELLQTLCFKLRARHGARSEPIAISQVDPGMKQ
jgi:hypothetical protein